MTEALAAQMYDQGAEGARLEQKAWNEQEDSADPAWPCWLQKQVQTPGTNKLGPHQGTKGRKSGMKLDQIRKQ